MKTRLAGITLDAITLATCAILTAIALATMAAPNSAADMMPTALATFAITITSGTAKILLNRKGQTNANHHRSEN